MMNVVSFFVTDDDDIVIQSGSSQELHLKDNALPGTVHLGVAPQGRYKYIRGEFVPYSPPITYQDARKSAYPSTEEQMDMLWHAMEQGVLPKAEPFYSVLLSVKTRYPKNS